MPTSTYIASLCDDRIFAQAQDIARGDRSLLTKQCLHDRGEIRLSCFALEGESWENRHCPNVSLDPSGSSIVDASCTCKRCAPARLCVHAAALALSFAYRPERFLGFQELTFRRTSEALATYMDETSAGAEEELPKNVELALELLCSYGEWSVRTRIAHGSDAYVVKDIAQLLSDIDHCAVHAYGASLAFAHTTEAFSDRALRIVAVLRRALRNREHAPASRGRSKESVDLSVEDVIDLLLALGSATCTVRADDGISQRTIRAHVLTQDPPLEGRILKVAGGYTLMRDDEASILWDGTRLAVWYDDAFYLCSRSYAAYGKFLKTLYRAETYEHFIAESDLTKFCRYVLPDAQGALHIAVPSELDALLPTPCAVEFYFDCDRTTLLCDSRVRYASRVYGLFEVSRSAPTPDRAACAASHDGSSPYYAPYRDERSEARARAMLERYFGAPTQGTTLFEPNPDRVILKLDARDTEQAASLLYGGLAALGEIGAVYTTPAFDRLLKKQTPTLSFGLSFAGNLIALDVSSEDIPEDELDALFESHRKKKHYHRLHSGAYIDLAAMDFSLLDDILEKIPSSIDSQHGNRLLFRPWFAPYLAASLPHAKESDAVRDEIASLDRSRKRTASLHSDDTHADRGCFAGKLRGYQAEGARWIATLASRGYGGILADEMGLGKTVQLLAFLAHAYADGAIDRPSLIVCPASLVYNWASECERFAPTLRVIPVEGPRARRHAAIARAFAHLNGKAGADVIVTSYQSLRLDIDAYRDQSVYCCALDEAQAIKNATAKTTRATKRIDASFRLALTGTPVENKPSELWSIFDFLMPGFLGSAMHFREAFELGILAGEPSASNKLHALIDPFVLRRTKRDVACDLPEKLEHVVLANMPASQRKLYAASEQRLRIALLAQKNDPVKRNDARRDRTVETLAEITRLRQLCCDPALAYETYEGKAAKIDVIADLVESAQSEGRKALVFSQFTSFLARIESEFQRRGIRWQHIVGATAIKQRLEIVEEFNHNDVAVLCVSLKAAGTGLNVTGASIVIHADPWWNQAAHEQATGRAHRIGQTQDVMVYDVIARDTIEERIRDLQVRKQRMAGQLIEGHASTDLGFGAISDEELYDLLSSDEKH